MYRARRRRLLLGVALILLLADAAAQLHGSAVHSRVLPSRARHDPSAAAVSWPVQGEAAFVLGNAPVTANPDQQPVPIASLAKVMTAYLLESLASATGVPAAGPSRTAGGPGRAPTTWVHRLLLARHRITDHPGSEGPLDPEEHA